MARARFITTGPFVCVIVAVAWIAWAGVGLATGHMYWQVWRGPPAHFLGWAAVLFALSVLVAAATCCVQLVVGPVAPRSAALLRSPRLGLLAVWALLLVAAIATQSLQDPAGALFGQSFNGLVSTEFLAWLMWSPKASQIVDGLRQFVFGSLLVSCAGLLLLAVSFKILGVSKSTIERHPLVFAPLFVVCGVPFLAAFSLELGSYVLGHLPSNSGSMPKSEFQSKASFALSMLVVVLATWSTLALLVTVLVARSCGVLVRWSNQEEFAEAVGRPSNPSIEPTAPGKPVVAAHVKR